MIDAHAEINASAQQSCYTTIATNSSQTAQLVSDTLEVAPMNEADEYDDQRITPRMNLFPSTLPPLSTASISNKNMSIRWWSGAMLHDPPSFPNLEDICGAICQMQSLKRNKKSMDDYGTKQKSASSIN